MRRLSGHRHDGLGPEFAESCGPISHGARSIILILGWMGVGNNG
jgi:hypothetical protein